MIENTNKTFSRTSYRIINDKKHIFKKTEDSKENKNLIQKSRCVQLYIIHLLPKYIQYITATTSYKVLSACLAYVFSIFLFWFLLCIFLFLESLFGEGLNFFERDQMKNLKIRLSANPITFPTKNVSRKSNVWFLDKSVLCKSLF